MRPLSNSRPIYLYSRPPIGSFIHQYHRFSIQGGGLSSNSAVANQSRYDRSRQPHHRHPPCAYGSLRYASSTAARAATKNPSKTAKSPMKPPPRQSPKPPTKQPQKQPPKPTPKPIAKAAPAPPKSSSSNKPSVPAPASEFESAVNSPQDEKNNGIVGWLSQKFPLPEEPPKSPLTPGGLKSQSKQAPKLASPPTTNRNSSSAPAPRRNQNTTSATAPKTNQNTTSTPPPKAYQPSKSAPPDRHRAINASEDEKQTTIIEFFSQKLRMKSPTSTVSNPLLFSSSNNNPKLNPTPESYEPDLNLPVKEDYTSTARFLKDSSWTLVQFFKNGGKRVWGSYKTAKQLRKQIKEARRKDPKIGPADVLTRAEFQLMTRSRNDLLRLIPFSIVAALAGEYLIVLWPLFTKLFPEPCRFPFQIQALVRKAENWRAERERRLERVAADLARRDLRRGALRAIEPFTSRLEGERLAGMGHYELLCWGVGLDAYPWVPWDYMSVLPPRVVLRRGLRRKLEYLERDDGLIERDGGSGELSGRELVRACMERGIVVTGKSERELRRELDGWKDMTVYPRKF